MQLERLSNRLSFVTTLLPFVMAESHLQNFMDEKPDIFLRNYVALLELKFLEATYSYFWFRSPGNSPPTSDANMNALSS